MTGLKKSASPWTLCEHQDVLSFLKRAVPVIYQMPLFFCLFTTINPLTPSCFITSIQWLCHHLWLHLSVKPIMMVMLSLFLFTNFHHFLMSLAQIPLVPLFCFVFCFKFVCLFVCICCCFLLLFSFIIIFFLSFSSFWLALWQILDWPQDS